MQQPDYLNPQSINRYPYALNNPNRYVDAEGASASSSPPGVSTLELSRMLHTSLQKGLGTADASVAFAEYRAGQISRLEFLQALGLATTQHFSLLPPPPPTNTPSTPRPLSPRNQAQWGQWGGVVTVVAPINGSWDPTSSSTMGPTKTVCGFTPTQQYTQYRSAQVLLIGTAIAIGIASLGVGTPAVVAALLIVGSSTALGIPMAFAGDLFGPPCPTSPYGR